MKRCAAIFNALIDMRGKAVGVGGLVRSINGGTSSSNPRPAYIEECVSRMRVFLISVAVSPVSLYVGGISAYNYEGINKITKCAAHLEMIWNPANTIQALYMAGFNCVGAGLTITTSYAVMKFTNTKGYPISNVNMYGTNYQGTCTINSSFFDLELLGSTFEGTINNTAAGLTTAELKSEDFLSSKGWEF